MVAAVTSVATQRELAIALDVTERQVRRYIADGMPGSPGFYDLAECRDWVDRNIKSPGSSGGGGDLKEKRLRAEIRKLNADAEAKEFKNAILQGELIYRDDVERQWSEALLRLKTRLEAVPDEMESLFPRESRGECTEVVREKIRLTLLELAAFEMEASDG